MAIISMIGRRSWSVRLLIWSIYTGLTLGALSMLYPFLLMMSGSTKSEVDNPDARIIPLFLRSELGLYRKYSEALFNESFASCKAAYNVEAGSFRDLELPAAVNPKIASAWEQFCREAELPFYSYEAGTLEAVGSRGVLPQRLRAFKRQMTTRYRNDIDALNKDMQTSFIGWNGFRVGVRPLVLRFHRASQTPFADAVRQFAASQGIDQRYYLSLEGFYRTGFLMMRYGKNIADYNQSHGTDYASWMQVHLDRQAPRGDGRTPAERADWESFVRSIVNLVWLRADTAAAPAYRAFLAAKYGTIETLNRNYGARYAGFDAVPLVDEPPLTGLVQADWAAFIEGWKDPATGMEHRIELDHLRVHSVDFLFRDWLRLSHGDIAACNAALDTTFDDFMDVLPPQQDLHWQYFASHKSELRREFLSRNFISVADYIIMHGRGMVNTVVYCALAILAALTINPLAAYALSRYKPPSSYKILLFLMLTMSFPPMVTQIPVFLMLRDLNLLNTYWALVLPSLANGYSIFLLKGFFDSLPQELYESAAIDGASEFRIFFQITMSLSKPILAVIALQTFTGAYGNFMMALLICQDEKMWTLMPWLYQLQQRSGQGVVMASLLVAAIPTFLVFGLCQNVIMRGIVVPVEK